MRRKTDHAVGCEVLVLRLEVKGMLVALADLRQTLHKQVFTVRDPLRHLTQKENPIRLSCAGTEAGPGFRLPHLGGVLLEQVQLQSLVQM